MERWGSQIEEENESRGYYYRVSGKNDGLPRGTGGVGEEWMELKYGLKPRVNRPADGFACGGGSERQN